MRLFVVDCCFCWPLFDYNSTHRTGSDNTFHVIMTVVRFGIPLEMLNGIDNGAKTN